MTPALTLQADALKFHEYLSDIHHRRLLVLVKLAVLMVPLFWVLDLFMIPAAKLQQFAIYRAAATVLLSLQYLVLKRTPLSVSAPVHGYFFCILLAVMISLMTRDLGGFESGYYAGLNLVLIAVIALIPWSSFHATLYALVIIGSYLGVNLGGFYRSNTFVNNVYFLLVTGIIAIAINRVHFQLIHREFFSAIKLRRVSQAQDTIMNSVEEGLFVLHFVDGDYIIGDHQSESVFKILGFYLPTQGSILKAFSNLLSEKKIEEFADFLIMVSAGKSSDEMLIELNPLSREWVTISRSGENERKALQFSFKRIGKCGSGSAILVKINDITREAKIQYLLRENESKSASESEVMMSMLHVGPALFEDFLNSVELVSVEVREMLRCLERESGAVETIDRIGQEIHSLKGNAALLNLHSFEQTAGCFEDIMMLGGPLDSEILVLLTRELNILDDKRNTMHDLLHRMRAFEYVEGEFQSALLALPDVVSGLAEKIAQRLGKKIKVVATDINFAGVSNRSAGIMRDLLVQLTRNAATHGIETPNERIQAGKNECGMIAISMIANGDTFCITYRDDGKAFDLASIRSQAIRQSGKAEEWDDDQLVQKIFEPRFSTSTSTSQDSGRGMGMSIISQRLKDAGGDLKINFARGQFCEFKLTMPLATLQ